MQTPFRIGADSNDANCTQEQAFTDLKFGAQLFLWSARQWLVSQNTGSCFQCDVAKPYSHYRCQPAIEHCHFFMLQLLYHPRRCLDIKHTSATTISGDERAMLRIVQSMLLPNERASARTAARSLVHGEPGDLCRTGWRYGKALLKQQLPFGHFRQLRSTQTN